MNTREELNKRLLEAAVDGDKDAVRALNELLFHLRKREPGRYSLDI